MSDEWAGAAFSARNSAVEWKNYAKKLEAELRGSQANLAGMEALKDAALKDLARADPSSYLLVQQNRQRIFDAAYIPVATGN